MFRRMKKQPTKISILLGAIVLIGAMASVAFALIPTVNPAGVAMVRASAESYVGVSENIGAGGNVRAEIVLSPLVSLQTTNPGLVTAFIGHLDPVPFVPPGPDNAVGPAWTLYDDDTP